MHCIPLGFSAQYLTPHLWMPLAACLPSKHAYAHTQIRAHRTQWFLFIVHSFMWRASCLAWYSIILQPTLSFPAIPRGTRWPQVHKSDCAIHWFHSNQRYCFSQPHFRLLASPPRSCSPLLSSNWKFVLLYIVVKSQHPILNLVLHCCKCTVIHKIDINSFALFL